MKFKNTNISTQALNPFLGFGWCTRSKFPKKDLILENQEEEKEEKIK